MKLYPYQEDFDEDDATVMEKFKHFLSQSIYDRLGTTVENEPIYLISTLLDPRFKELAFFGGPSKINKAKLSIFILHPLYEFLFLLKN